MAPAATALQVADAAHDWQNQETSLPTASTAVAFCSHNRSVRDSVRFAQELLRSHAKQRRGKHGLSVRVARRGGGSDAVSMGWAGLNSAVAAFAAINTGGDPSPSGPVLAATILSDLRVDHSELGSLWGTGRDRETRQVAEAEVARLILRHVTGGTADERKRFANDLVQLIGSSAGDATPDLVSMVRLAYNLRL